jgi:glycosyltransferase involved in cell wall biosynthesis
MIRVFVDAHVFDGEFQGTRTFIRGIYSVLAKKNDLEIYMAANDIKNLAQNFAGFTNIHFIQYKSSSSFTRLAFEMPSIIRKNKIDFAHFQYIVPPIKNCRFIVTTHDVIFNEFPREFSWWYRMRKNFLYRISAGRSDILTTVSEYSKESIQKYLGTGSRKIHVIPNGVGNIFFNAPGKATARNFINQKYGFENFILYVSRIEPRKNHVMLLRAFLELGLYERGYHLVLLGDETIPTPEFDNIMNELNPEIGKFIWINGSINDDELISFYCAASVFVYPSKAEGFGIPPLEAAALKTPVLCSRSSAMNEYNFFGKNLFDPYDYPAFKEKLNKLISSPKDEDELGDISDTIRRNYSWECSAENLYQIIVGEKANLQT